MGALPEKIYNFFRNVGKGKNLFREE